MSGYFEPQKSANQKFAVDRRADDDEVILTSRTYATRQHALDGIESVRKHSSKDAYYTRGQSTARQPFLVLNATNGEAIASSQMYPSSAAMESAIASVKQNGSKKASDDNS